MQSRTAALWLLRLSLSVVFAYAAISSFLSPQDWAGYLPHVLTTHFSATLLLHFFSVYELLLVVALFSGIYLRYVALICALTLGGIVVSNLSLLPISFRDVGLGIGALALALLAD